MPGKNNTNLVRHTRVYRVRITGLQMFFYRFISQNSFPNFRYLTISDRYFEYEKGGF